MALKFTLSTFLPLLLLLTLASSDPDILSDFIVPPNTTLDGTFFTYTGLRPGAPSPPTLRVTKATRTEFPALDGQSVSFALLEFPPGGINPPHTHPRGAELLFLVIGTLEVTLVDTKNVPYTQLLKTGDMFIFPKGLLHLQYNRNHNLSAVAISAFGSASAGTVSVPSSVFGTGIDDVILAKAFKTDVGTIAKLKAGLTNP